ncbi:uncharacterized protein DNG_00323 [Cephalotrichum gorgonifer]|uniref:Uncharacterized protein n=1 Tax=Cephalotrichum gorgonifer TaxID=2041049 RepID=A0AAE8MQ60_9PEZI|nr:uncharacterized protein DNG_00323 [Cephalotrichum gorgonifer]
MPRRQAARAVRETSGSEDPADIFTSAQQKMTTLQRSRNRRRRAIATKHAEELDKVKKRIESRLEADRKRTTQAWKEALAKHLDAVTSVLEIEKKIEANVQEMHRQCRCFIELLSLVHEGRAQEALRVDLDNLVHRYSGGSKA